MAVKFQYIDNKHMMTFKALPKLVFSEDTKGYVKYGKDNLYPQELVRLFNEHPEHRAIVNRKARYIFGKGIKAVNEVDTIKVNTFVDNFNRKESLNQCGKKLTTNTELFNGVYVEVITNLQGQPIEFYFLNSANCRISECETKLYFSKNWNRNTQSKDIKTIYKFENNGTAGTFFIDFKYYTASASKLESVYPTAQYQSIVNDINTDIDISTFNKNYVSNGFSIGKIINFFNGQPTDDMIHSIERSFKGTYTGENGESLMITHSDRDDKAPEVVDVSVQDLSEKFAFTSKRAMKKIFAGHEMAPELFNIKFDESFLSGSPDLLILQELFVKGYIEPRQSDLLEFISYLSFLKTGEYLEMMFEPISLIGADLSNDTDLTQDERRKLKGYEPLKAVPLDINGQPIPVQASEVNDALVGLSATERNDINRIVHHFKSKKNGTSEALAIASLGAYGFSVSDAKKFLGINEGIDAKMSKQISEDKFLAHLEKNGIVEDPSTYTVIKRERVKSSNEALKYERQIMKFADALVITVQELDNAVLNALKGNPSMSINELVDITQSEFFKVEQSIARLIDKEYLTDSISGFKPTEKALEKKTDVIESDEIYTLYTYGLNEGISYEGKPNQISDVLLSTSHDFCKKVIGKQNFKKMGWDFETIDGWNNDFGDSAWDYRGGFTNKGGYIDSTCNHSWYAETRLRKKEKK
jgi:hypothetical protein